MYLFHFKGNEVSNLGEFLQSEISSELDKALDGGSSGQDGGDHSGDDDIFKQLSDSSALLEQFFDFVNCDIKVWYKIYKWLVKYLFLV